MVQGRLLLAGRVFFGISCHVYPDVSGEQWLAHPRRRDSRQMCSRVSQCAMIIREIRLIDQF
jgi:hypothetical protein